MKLKTFGLTLVATAFMASAVLAQTGMMQPIPNPPEKHKMMSHKKKMSKHMSKHMAEGSKADAKADKAEAKADAKADAKPAMPAMPAKK
jgi:hypothetical protein